MTDRVQEIQERDNWKRAAQSWQKECHETRAKCASMEKVVEAVRQECANHDALTKVNSDGEFDTCNCFLCEALNAHDSALTGTENE